MYLDQFVSGQSQHLADGIEIRAVFTAIADRNLDQRGFSVCVVVRRRVNMLVQLLPRPIDTQ
jgi:hypothetical protein